MVVMAVFSFGWNGIQILFGGGRLVGLRQARSFQAARAVVAVRSGLWIAGGALQQAHEAVAKFGGADEIDKEVDRVVGIRQEGDHLIEEEVLSPLFQHAGVVELINEQVVQTRRQGQQQEHEGRADQHDTDGTFSTTVTRVGRVR